ncbi:MAG: S8 family peptidase [Lachnospiraceae bacterium]|nr:S8 family peptidase [Lachnospiraceae bacterium]
MNNPELCRIAIYSNDYYDFIIDYTSEYSREDAACFQKVSDRFDIAYYEQTDTPELNPENYPYAIIPKCFALTDQTALEASGILRLQNPSGLDLSGEGVLVGFLDTGINYMHPAFRNADGTTRIAAIWDQTDETGTPPEGFSYGAYYGKEEINAALRAENPSEAVPSADENGHGTFLAGVACGSADAAMDFTGAAPESEILMAKCKEAKPYLREYYFVPEGVLCYQENDLMLALSWLVRMAERLQRPLVICVGMGSAMGNHAGEDALSVLCGEIGRLRLRGVVTSAGNEANARHHYWKSGLSENRTDQVEISVGNNVTGFYMECWAAVPEIYRVSVLSPTGERFAGSSGIVGRDTHTFLFEKTTVTLDYMVTGSGLGSQLVYLRFLAPYPGIWTVELTPVLAIEGSIHCWLPLTGLLQGEVFFLQSDPDTTILSPGMSAAAINTGAYRADSGGIDPDSGRGYSILGVIKPDILAPGVNVCGPGLRTDYTRRSGSSVSAAVTAGGCAQIFQWGILQQGLTYLNSTNLSNILIRGAIRNEDRTYPDRAFGYGLLDVYQALGMLRL